MKILKELEEVKLVIVEMEVNLGKEKRKGLTLCAKRTLVLLSTKHST